MTKEDIIRIAKEVLLLNDKDNPNDASIAQFIGTLSDFAALVAAPLEEKIKELEYQLKEARND
jgi:hypothetical protein